MSDIPTVSTCEECGTIWLAERHVNCPSCFVKSDECIVSNLSLQLEAEYEKVAELEGRNNDAVQTLRERALRYRNEKTEWGYADIAAALDRATDRLDPVVTPTPSPSRK